MKRLLVILACLTLCLSLSAGFALAAAEGDKAPTKQEEPKKDDAGKKDDGKKDGKKGDKAKKGNDLDS
jgi:hypothetical protein